jgi:phage gpG-like protein
MSGILTVGEFIAHIGRVEHNMRRAENLAIVRACKMVQKAAQNMMGHPQPFWLALEPETIERKANGNTPLLETGELRASIKITAPVRVGGEVVGYVGSNNDKAVWHELGTSRVPPRPFLSTAAAAKEKEIVKLTGDLVFAAMVLDYKGTFEILHLVKEAVSELEDAFGGDSGYKNDVTPPLEEIGEAIISVGFFLGSLGI